MTNRKLALAPLVLLAAACTTPAYVSPVEVTRFSAPQATALATGTISIAMAPGNTWSEVDSAPYRAALAGELQALGYSVVGTGGAQQALLSLDETVSTTDGRRSPVNVGVGGSTGTYGSGVGLGVGINLGGNRASERIERLVSVAIRPAAGGGNLWEGRASMTATTNSDFADPAAAAPRLLDALFAGFPGESGATIEVE